MAYLLNAAYLLLLLLVWPWLLYQGVRKGKYREGFSEKLLGLVPVRSGDRPCIWLHAVSVGEVNLLVPLVAALASRRPDCELFISTTTKTGCALARTRFADRTVFYCPLDFSWATRRAMRRARPDLLVLAELELWPNLVRAAAECNVPVAVVNGRLGERSFRGYRRVRPVVAKVLSQIDCIAAQNETYADRFRQLGASAESVVVTGSMKFDGAQTDRDLPRARELRRLAGIDERHIVFLAGSTQHPEESIALAAFAQFAGEHPELRLILVPRHPERFDAVARMLDESRHRWQRRSRLESETADPNARVLLVDTVGELGTWWAAAHVAFVGGSLSTRGGQNMIEPAAYGAAVAFGPNTWNFRDVTEAMLRENAAVVVRSQEQLARFLQRAIADPDWSKSLGERARRLVLAQQGATARTVECLDRLLNKRARLPDSKAA